MNEDLMIACAAKIAYGLDPALERQCAGLAAERELHGRRAHPPGEVISLDAERAQRIARDLVRPDGY